MAILRSEIQNNLSSRSDTRSTYDCIVAAAADLSDADTAHMGIGSMAFVMENSSCYIKTADGWTLLTS